MTFDTYAAAYRWLESTARLRKLKSGFWSASSKLFGVRQVGSTREAALDLLAHRLPRTDYETPTPKED